MLLHGVFVQLLCHLLMITGSEVLAGVCPPSAVPVVKNAFHNGDGTYDVGDVITYTCDNGYIRYHHTPDNVTCLANDTFSTPIPACFKSLNTVCYPNGTIILANPDTSLYLFAHASDTDNTCTTEWIADFQEPNARVQIVGCAKGADVTVSFSSVKIAEGIHSNTNLVFSYHVVVMCEEIDPTGVIQTVTQGLQPGLSSVAIDPVNPTIKAAFALRSSSAMADTVSSAKVGEELYWTLDVPEEYTAIPVMCTAYAGTSTSDTPTKLLVSNGCASDAILMESFSESKVIIDLVHEKRYYTKMWAFKFQSSDHVLFHCDIKFCPAQSSSCHIDCGGTKKRSADVSDSEVYDHVVLTTTTSTETSRIHPIESVAIAFAFIATCWVLKLTFA